MSSKPWSFGALTLDVSDGAGAPEQPKRCAVLVGIDEVSVGHGPRLVILGFKRSLQRNIVCGTVLTLHEICAESPNVHSLLQEFLHCTLGDANEQTRRNAHGVVQTSRVEGIGEDLAGASVRGVCGLVEFEPE